MGEEAGDGALSAGLNAALRRAGIGKAENLTRLTGGATMESWRFSADGRDYVLRRAPSEAFMEERPFGHPTEAEIIRKALAAGVTAPEVVVELQDSDGIGSGFIMRALPGTPDPRTILASTSPAQLVQQAARDLARIHAIAQADLPDDVPTLDYREGVTKLLEQFEDTGGDRPIIALGLRWLLDNLPEPVEPVLNHGDYRLGNILVEDSQLTGVLDWELCHFGDPHEDLAFGCMPVWRFGAYERPALGLGSLEDYFGAYEAAGGCPVDPARFRFWTIYRTVWWALGCLRNAQMWRSGDDRMLERVVISRRTSEPELDLLLLLEEEWPGGDRGVPEGPEHTSPENGEASAPEVIQAVTEWLATIKDRMEGHDRFQLAVARNALGIVQRDWNVGAVNTSAAMSKSFLEDDPLDPEYVTGLFPALRRMMLDKVGVDSPKYASLAVARSKWLGGN